MIDGNISDTLTGLCSGALLLVAHYSDRLLLDSVEAVIIGGAGALGALLIKDLYRRFIHREEKEPKNKL